MLFFLCKQQAKLTIGRLRRQLDDIQTSMENEIEKEVVLKRKQLKAEKEALASRISSTSKLCHNIEQLLKMKDEDLLHQKAPEIISSFKKLVLSDSNSDTTQYFDFVPMFHKVSEVLNPSKVGFVRTQAANPLDLELKISDDNDISVSCYRGNVKVLADYVQVMLRGGEDIVLPLKADSEKNRFSVDISRVQPGSYLVHCLLYKIHVSSSPASILIKKNETPDVGNAESKEQAELQQSLATLQIADAFAMKNLNEMQADANNNFGSKESQHNDVVKEKLNPAQQPNKKPSLLEDAKRLSSFAEPIFERRSTKTTSSSIQSPFAFTRSPPSPVTSKNFQLGFKAKLPSLMEKSQENQGAPSTSLQSTKNDSDKLAASSDVQRSMISGDAGHKSVDIPTRKKSSESKVTDAPAP
jgi:hypothetical protein